MDELFFHRNHESGTNQSMNYVRLKIRDFGDFRGPSSAREGARAPLNLTERGGSPGVPMRSVGREREDRKGSCWGGKVHISRPYKIKTHQTDSGSACKARYVS